MDQVVRELVRNFRKAVVLIAAEKCGLRDALVKGYDLPRLPSNTAERVVAAAVALGMCEGVPARWKNPYLDLAMDGTEWGRALAMIHHQQTYLQLADALSQFRATMPSPQEQLALRPRAYIDFLHGVEASHIRHADWLSQLPELSNLHHLIDLGGGLGTFSRSWVRSKAGRHATLVDLPGLGQHLSIETLGREGITFVEINLGAIETLPEGEVYLLANVLHLLAEWQRVLRIVATKIAAASTLVVMEADPEGPAGALFDLQVHLRSGGVGGILQTETLGSALRSCRLTNLHAVSTIDPMDPFERKYCVWLGQKTQ